MVNSVKFTSIDSQNATTCTKSSQTCISIIGLTTTADGNYETDGKGLVFLDFNWTIPAGKTLTVNPGHTFTILSKLTVNGKIRVQGALVNLSENSLNITGTCAVIVEEDATLNNGNDVNLFGSIVNTGSLVVYGTLNNKSGSKITNKEKGEVSYVGTIDNNGTITNQGTFYKSVLGGDFKGKPSGIALTNGLFGILSTTYTNTKTIRVPKNTELTNNGTINNNIGGTITNDGKITNYATIVNFVGSRINNNGTINNNNGGTINNNRTIINNGTIYNEGTINNFGTITNNGTIDNDEGTINNKKLIKNNGKICNGPPWYRHNQQHRT